MSDTSRMSCARRYRVVLAAAAFGALPALGFAADFVFTGTTNSDYNTGTNWDQGTVPGASDRANIAGGLTATMAGSPASPVNTFYIGANTDGPAPLPGSTTTNPLDDGAHSNTNGDGTFNQTAGDLVVNTWASIGEASVGANTGAGTYNLSGGSFTLHGTDNIAVGQGGTGTFNISGNSQVQIDSEMNIGRWSGTDTTKPGNNAQGRGNGTVVQSGNSSVNIPGGLGGTTESLQIGRFGDGSYTLQDNATLTANHDISIAFGATSTGVLNQSGGTLNSTGGWFFLGHDAGGAQGTYNLSGGVAHIAGRLLDGAGSGSTGTINQTGGTLTVDGDLSVADQGNGNLNISAGTLNANGGLNDGGWNTGNGNIKVSGSAVVNTTDLSISRDDPAGTSSSTGVFTQSGGTVNVSGHTILGSDPTNETNGHTNGTYTLTGGNLNLGTNGLQLGDPNHAGATGVFAMQGGVLDFRSSKLLIAPGAGSSTAFVYTGGDVRNLVVLDQEAGTLELGSATPLSVAGDGTHSYTLGSGGTLQVDILAAANGKMLTTNGAVSLAGLLSLHDTSLAALGTQYTILDPDAGAISGAFSNAPDGGLVLADNGQAFQISYAGGDGNAVVLTAVPEPTIIGLIGIGLTGLLARRRRNR